MIERALFSDRFRDARDSPLAGGAYHLRASNVAKFHLVFADVVSLEDRRHAVVSPSEAPSAWAAPSACGGTVAEWVLDMEGSRKARYSRTETAGRGCWKLLCVEGKPWKVDTGDYRCCCVNGDPADIREQ